MSPQSQRRSRLTTRRWRFGSPMTASTPRSRRPGSRSRMASSSPLSGRPDAENRRCSMSPPACSSRLSGAVRIFDQPLTGLNRDAGYLFQADALFPWKTAIDNVAIGLEIAGAPRARRWQRAQGWLTSVGLGAFGNRYPHMLSGGQRKRVGLAQVLIRDPKNPADGRAVRAARCPDPPDHGQSAAGTVERRPQGGAVRHPRSGRGDRARRPRRDHVGGAGRAHHRRLAGAAGAPARHFRSPAGEGISLTSPGDMECSEGRGVEGLRAVGAPGDAG